MEQRRKWLPGAAGGVIWGFLAATGMAAEGGPPPTAEALYEIIQGQQAQIDALRAELSQLRAGGEAPDTGAGSRGAPPEALYEIVEAQQREIESIKSGGRAAARQTQLGGYGELHYNNLDNQLPGGGAFEEIDLHRFVLFFAHEFSERARFYSELELEHAFIEDESACGFEVPAGGFAGGEAVDCAGGSSPGELELEQAYVELDVGQHQHLTAGLQLIPVGIINTTHEPPTFYGVERNPVETNIVPSTWWEAGVGMHGELAPDDVPGLSYDLMFHSGLQTPTGGSNAFRIRRGRTKGAEAPASDGAFTARLRWAGIPGVELGLTGQYQSDITQGAQDIAARLWEAHAALQRGAFGLRALYARWDLDKGAPGAGPATGDSPGRDRQSGWYVEPSWRLAERSWGRLGFFARYNEWDNNAGSAGDTGMQQTDVGLNFWPDPNIVFKLDYQDQEAPDGVAEFDGVNLGVGYQF